MEKIIIQTIDCGRHDYWKVNLELISDLNIIDIISDYSFLGTSRDPLNEEGYAYLEIDTDCRYFDKAMKFYGKEYELDFHEGIVNHNIEMQYLGTLYDIIISGHQRETRNGITQSKFMKTLTCDLADGFPLLTTKKMFWKGIVEELLFFIRGQTNTNILTNKKVHIWTDNTRQSFLKKRKLR